MNGNKDSWLHKLLTWTVPYARKDIPVYSEKEKIMFSLGMFGQNLIYEIVGSYLSVFYTDVIFVPALALLVITVISRIWDALNDLLMGNIVDKTHTRWGKCRPYLKYAPGVIGLFTVLMFLPVKDMASPAKIIFVIVTWLLWEALYTLGDIPLWGMTSLMTDDSEKRTKLVSLARIVGGCSAVAVFLFEPLVNLFGSTDFGWFSGSMEKEGYTFFSYQQGYFFTVLAFTVIAVIFFKLPFIFSRERVKPKQENENFSFKTGLKLFFSNKYFSRVMLSQILGAASGTMSMVIYLATWIFANGGDYSLWYILLLVPGYLGYLLAMLGASPLDKKFDKINVVKVSSIIAAIACGVMFFSYMFLGTSTLSLVVICICQFVAGFSGGFTSVFYTTMIQDCIDYKEYECGKRYDGIYLSGLNFISKFSNAVRLAITYLAFFIVNYSEKIEIIKDTMGSRTTSLNFMAEYPELAWTLIILGTLVPGVAYLLQIIPLFGYKLTNKEHDKLMSELIARRTGADK